MRLRPVDSGGRVGRPLLIAVVAVVAFYDLARRRSDWGEMSRKGFTTITEAPLPPA